MIDIYVMIWYSKFLNLKTILRPSIEGGMPLKCTHVVPSLNFKCTPRGFKKFSSQLLCKENCLSLHLGLPLLHILSYISILNGPYLLFGSLLTLNMIFTIFGNHIVSNHFGAH